MTLRGFCGPLFQYSAPFRRLLSINRVMEAGKPMKIITEGTAMMHYDPKEVVFYNKVQVLNRDLSIQVIKLYSETLREEKRLRIEKKLAKLKDRTDLPSSAHASVETNDGITILDALAASGLRSIRYLKEIPDVKHLTINDLLPAATDLAKDNCQRNDVDMSKVIISNQDATALMYTHRDPSQQYDVIDLDPYGSAVPFLDGAVQAVRDGGLLCVTCTDMTALAGAYPEVCFAKYQSMPVKAKYGHEMALRILLHSIDSTANRYKRHIVPWLSLSIDFYVRVFVRVFESAAEVKKSCTRRSLVYQCTRTPTFYVHPLGERKVRGAGGEAQGKGQKGGDRSRMKTAPAAAAALGEEQVEAAAEATGGAEELTIKGTEKPQKQKQQKDKEGASAGEGGAFGAVVVRTPHVCAETGSNMKVGGPFWSAPIHDQKVVDELHRRVVAHVNPSSPLFPAIPTAPRLGGVLQVMKEELKDVPLYYSLPDLASVLQLKVPPIGEFWGALKKLGYRVSQFHHDPHAVKTDAPAEVLWDVMRAYAALNPPLVGKKGLNPLAQSILAQESKVKDVDFSAVVRREKGGLARFAPNPEANWGPKRRAGRAVKDEDGGDMEVDAVADEGEEEQGDVQEPEHKRSKK